MFVEPDGTSHYGHPDIAPFRLRYIGNKTRLLDFIGDVLDEHGIGGVGAHAVDAFAGTASVGRFLKRRGFRVTTCDIMTYSHLLGGVGVQLDEVPSFAKVLETIGRSGSQGENRDVEKLAFTYGVGIENEARVSPGDGIPESRIGGQISIEGATSASKALSAVLHHLNTALTPRSSLITSEFSADERGGGKRMYFTRENGERIDAIRETIDEWHHGSLIDGPERDVLVASLIEALDAVANTTGVYAAYVKSWQPNALRPLTLRPPHMTPGIATGSRALLGDINRIASSLGRVDLLYLDPPYNNRQYSSYYHIPELVATGWADGAPTLRGKTGLIPHVGKQSDWSKRGRCVAALNELLGEVDAKYVVMSYNSEGIIPEAEIRQAFEAVGKPGTFRVHERDYARYRSDKEGVGRNYKARRVVERVYFVEMR